MSWLSKKIKQRAVKVAAKKLEKMAEQGETLEEGDMNLPKERTYLDPKTGAVLKKNDPVKSTEKSAKDAGELAIAGILSGAVTAGWASRFRRRWCGWRLPP
jgi:hypothetical protein